MTCLAAIAERVEHVSVPHDIDNRRQIELFHRLLRVVGRTVYEHVTNQPSTRGLRA